jgi:hypothetical protein
MKQGFDAFKKSSKNRKVEQADGCVVGIEIINRQ